jgi:hypothetical protein
VIIDGILRGSASQSRLAKAAEHCLEPHQVAKAYLQLAGQPAGAWTHEIDLRPQAERF